MPSEFCGKRCFVLKTRRAFNVSPAWIGGCCFPVKLGARLSVVCDSGVELCACSPLRHKMKLYNTIRHSMRNMAPDSPAAARDRDRVRADEEFLRPPSAVLPASLFVLGGNDDQHTQSSLNTISSTINTMMGTTIVALPLGFAHCGIILGLIITAAMCAISCATCIIIINSSKGIPEFSQLVGRYAGQYWKGLGWVMSIGVFVGAACVYHILMQESLFSLISTIVTQTGEDVMGSGWSRPFAAGIICLIAPALVAKDLAWLVKLNAFGFVALWFTIFFVCYHGVVGLTSGHFDLQLMMEGGLIKQDHLQVALFGRSTFGSLGGMMMLSFFIHNAIQPITANASKDTKARDVVIAYVITAVLYALVGVLGCFGFAALINDADTSDASLKSNFLDMFGNTFASPSEILAFIARLALLLQLITVYPILIMVIRNSFFGVVYGSEYPSRLHVVALVVTVMGLTFACAALNVDVGSAVRFTGAVGGFSIVFIIPCVVDFYVKSSAGRLGWANYLFYVAVIATGMAFFVIQFIPSIAP